MAGFGFSNVGFAGSLSGTVSAVTTAPLLRYRSADVTGTAWTNSGSTGPSHNMAVVGNAQVVTAASGTTTQYVRFDGTGYYQTVTAVPTTITGSMPRTIGLRMFAETASDVNLFGYGVANTGQALDFINTASLSVVVHYFGTSYGSSATTVGNWMDVTLTLDYASSNNIHTLFVNGAAGSVYTNPPINTQSSPLRMGVGTYTPLNNTARFRIAGLWVQDHICTQSEITQIFNTL